MEIRLDGKVSVVSGIGSGIGRGIALKFLQAGASVVGADRHEDRLNSIIEEAKRMGIDTSKLVTMMGDVSNYEFAGSLIGSATKRFASLDILVNNVGGSAPYSNKSFTELGETAWRDTINENLITVLNCSKLVLPQMISQRMGKIVNISSITGMGDSADGGDLYSVYAATKAGVIAFTKALARELAQYRINVNCVSPGIVRTRFFEKVSKDVIEGYLKKIPWGRVGEPDDIANVVLFLASKEADYITGENVAISGGLVMH